MVAKQPLIQAFDRIIELGVTRKLKNEQMRLQTLFAIRLARSRCIVSPGGRKFRPGLVDYVEPTRLARCLPGQKQRVRMNCCVCIVRPVE